MTKVTMTVNGKAVTGDVEERTLLVEFIRSTEVPLLRVTLLSPAEIVVDATTSWCALAPFLKSTVPEASVRLPPSESLLPTTV